MWKTQRKIKSKFPTVIRVVSRALQTKLSFHWGNTLMFPGTQSLYLQDFSFIWNVTLYIVSNRTIFKSEVLNANQYLEFPLRLWLHWRHNERHGVSNHQYLDCLFSRLFGCTSKKTSNSPSLAFVREIHRWPVNSPHQGPVAPKMFHLMTSSCSSFFASSLGFFNI